jgi:hypothetical protein
LLLSLGLGVFGYGCRFMSLFFVIIHTNQTKYSGLVVKF